MMSESIDHTEEGTREKPARFEWTRLFQGHRWLIGNIPFLLFLAMLTVVYIYNGHYAEKKIKDINRTASALKELQYEYKTLKSELMFMQKQSEVVRLAKPMGFTETTVPPVRLKDTLR
jgi:hypothetical protein